MLSFQKLKCLWAEPSIRMKQAGSGCGRGRDTQAVHVCLLPGSSTWLPTHSLFHSVAVESARLAQCRARGAFTYQLQEEALLLVIERTTTSAISHLLPSLCAHFICGDRYVAARGFLCSARPLHCMLAVNLLPSAYV